MESRPDSRSDRPRRPRRALRLAASITGALILLLIVALLALHTERAKRYVLAQATEWLAQEEIDFHASRLDYNLFRLTVRLQDVTLRTLGPNDAPFAKIAEVALDLSPLDLLRGRYVVQEGTIVRPEIYVAIDEKGHSNIPRVTAEPAPKEPPDAETPLDYLIETFSIVDARIRYEDRRQALDLSLPVRSIEIDGSRIPRRHTLRLDAGPGRVELDERSAAIDHIRGDLALDAGAIAVRRLELAVAGSTFELTGSVADFDAPRSDLALAANLDVTKLAAFAGVAEPIGGTLRANLTARGPLEALAVEADVKGDALSFRDLPVLQLDAQAVYDASARQVRLDRLAAVSSAGTVRAQGLVATDAGDSRLDVHLESLDLGHLTDALALPYRVASRVDGQAGAFWPALDYERAAGRAVLKLTPTRQAPSAGIVPVAGTIVANAEDDDVGVDLRGLRALGTTVDGRLSLAARRDLRGSLTARAVDLEQVVSGAEAFLGEGQGTLVGIPLGGPLHLDARVGGTIDEPVVDATVDAPRLAVADLPDLTLQAEVSYSAAVVTLRRADVGWQDVALHAAGRLALRGANPVELRVSVEEATVESLLAELGRSEIPARGVLSLRAEVDGTLEDPRASLELRGADLVAYDETLGTLVVDAGLSNRTAQLVQLRLDKPQPGGDGVITAAGSYDLDRGAYAFQVETEGLRLVNLKLPDDTPVRAEVAFRAEGSGTLAEPAATAELDLQTLRVQEDQHGDLRLRAVVADDRATLRARLDKYQVDAHAELGTAEPYPAQFDLLVDNLDLATLPLELETPLTGHVRAEVTGTGDLADPLEGTATATIDRLAVTWADQRIESDGPVSIRYAGRQFDIERLVVRALGSTLSAHGTLPVDLETDRGTLELDARLDLATLAKYAPPDAGIEAGGDVRLTGTITGSLGAIEPDLVLEVRDAFVSSPELDPAVSNVGARFEIGDGELNGRDIHAEWGSARLDASVRLPFALLPEELPVELPRPSGPAEAALRVTGLDLATIPGAPEGLAGTVSVVAEARAGRAELAAVDARVTFPELQLAFDNLTLAQQGISTIAVNDGVARVEQFRLEGSVGHFELRGSAGLIDPQPLDVTLHGELDAAAVRAFTDAVLAEGTAVIQLAAGGRVAEPMLDGFIELADANVLVGEPAIGLERLNAWIDLVPTRATLSRLDGSINGGTLSGQGVVELDGGPVPNIDLQFTMAEVAFDEPIGLRSLSDAKLAVTRRDDHIVVGGRVTIQEAALTDNVNLDSGIFAALTAPRTLDLTEARNPLLERLRFDIHVDTATPVLVDNNLARAELQADLRLLGSPYDTGMSGRITIAEDGELILNERRYAVERGIITFTSDVRIEPLLDLVMHTAAGRYDITVEISGTPDDTKTVLRSDPSLPEPDIVAVLVTGRTLDEMRGEEFEVAQRQMLSLLSGRATAGLGRRLERATGLSTVRVEPQLIADEADPGARLTVGQDLTNWLSLIYSTDLANSSDQLWVAEYDVTRHFDTRVVRQSDASYRFDFRHDVRFGGQAEPHRMRRTLRRTIGTVTVTGEGDIPEAKIRERLRLKTGDRYDFFEVRRRIGRVEGLYVEQGQLQVRVRLERVVRGDTVDLSLAIAPGPSVEILYEGFDPPSRLRRDVHTTWRRGVFDMQRTDGALRVIRDWLVKRRYFDATLEHEVVEATPADRRVVFRVEPGVRFDRVHLAFQGADGIDPAVLEEIVNEQKLGPTLFTDPGSVIDLLGRYYREEGYLTAQLGEPQYDFDEGTRVARVVIPVSEGPRFTIRDITIAGATVYPAAELVAEIPLDRGDPYLPATVERSLARIRELYWDRGYNDFSGSYALRLDPDAGWVEVEIEIQEGPRVMVADVQVQGTHKTSEDLVLGQLEFEPHGPLRLPALSRSRRNLYDTGAYAIVDITQEVIDGTDGDRGSSQVATGDKPVHVSVGVREVQPFQIRYGASFDTERGPGGIVDLSNHNSLGYARVVGVRGRYDLQLREARLYMSQPMLQPFPVQTTANLFYREERELETVDGDPHNVDSIGVSIQQEKRLGEHYLWSYGYRFERARTFGPGLTTQTVDVAPLTSTLTRETRDDVLDASEGSFMSHAFSFSPEFLGSDVRFIRYFGQFFKYVPLQPTRRERFTYELIRPRLVYAGGVRVGLARGLGGQDVPSTERFLAGGSTTLRGFAQNSLGPIDSDGVRRGEAMLVINNELRFPLYSIFDGAAFLDIGNVYDRIGDLSLTDLRGAVGIGLRVRTPWFLVRGDYGVPLDRREGESRSRFFFSIGQAF